MEIKCVVITTVDTGLGLIESISTKNTETLIKAYPGLECDFEPNCELRKTVGKHHFLVE